MLDALSRMTKLDGKQILTELTYQEGVSTGKGVTFEVSQPKTIKGGAQNPSSNLVDIQFEPLMSFENMKRNDASFRTTAKSYFYVIMEEWAHAKDKAINNGHNSGQGILTGGDLDTGVQDFQTSITGHRGTDPLLFFTGEYQSYNENGNWQINKFDFSKKSKFSEWPAKMGKRWNSNIEKIDNVIDNLK